MVMVDFSANRDVPLSHTTMITLIKGKYQSRTWFPTWNYFSCLPVSPWTKIGWSDSIIARIRWLQTVSRVQINNHNISSTGPKFREKIPSAFIIVMNCVGNGLEPVLWRHLAAAGHVQSHISLPLSRLLSPLLPDLPSQRFWPRLSPLSHCWWWELKWPGECLGIIFRGWTYTWPA